MNLGRALCISRYYKSCSLGQGIFMNLHRFYSHLFTFSLKISIRFNQWFYAYKRCRTMLAHNCNVQKEIRLFTDLYLNNKSVKENSRSYLLINNFGLIVDILYIYFEHIFIVNCCHIYIFSILLIVILFQ